MGRIDRSGRSCSKRGATDLGIGLREPVRVVNLERQLHEVRRDADERESEEPFMPEIDCAGDRAPFRTPGCEPLVRNGDGKLSCGCGILIHDRETTLLRRRGEANGEGCDATRQCVFDSCVSHRQARRLYAGRSSAFDPGAVGCFQVLAKSCGLPRQRNILARYHGRSEEERSGAKFS